MEDYNKDHFSMLRCLNCNGNLRISGTYEYYKQYNNCIDCEIICKSCGTGYPVIQGIPIMFKDTNRIKALIDSKQYEYLLKNAEQKMKQASQVTGSELERFKNNNDPLSDALSWEILFWEKWKHSDKGFLEYDKEKIERYLENDVIGGGKLRFFKKVCNENLAGKSVLNIGAGRDFLLEKYLESGCKVVEQDIVLESLLYLKKRGASFCICCDARSLPFKDNTFDISTCFEVLHHIWPIEQPIAELIRVTSGNIYITEPNYFSLTRIALLLPNPIKKKVKQYYSGDYSHSPYETPINPYLFKKIIKKSDSAQIIELTFTKSSWISKEFKSFEMKALRILNIILVNLLPIGSSHFMSVIKNMRKEDKNA
jgi:ubiquinone/menaquinone biosynthesis C-methylase UbiE/uncharacterized protein YbaR (Trm112 family)